MAKRSHDEIDDLVRAPLPAPPRSWVALAEDLPRLEQAVDRLEELDVASGEDAMRSALEHVGLNPDEDRLRALTRLRELRSRR